MAEILPFFAVPFGFAKLENCAPLNQELRTLFLTRSTEGGEPKVVVTGETACGAGESAAWQAWEGRLVSAFVRATKPGA